MNRWRRLVELVVVFAGLTLFAACGSIGSGNSGQPTAQESATAKEFADLLSRGRTVDIDPLKSVQELADASAIIIRGRIDRIDPGRTFGTSGGLPSRRTLMLVADVRQTYKGISDEIGSTAYVEVDATLAGDARDVDAIAPRQLDLMLFLVPISETTPDDVPEALPETWPKDRPVYEASRPEGIVIDNPDGPPVSVYGDELAGAQDLSAYIP